MDLGKANLRKVGINNLYSAVHPHHGVMWTDGRAIYLAPLHVEGKQMQNATSVRLGEFESVTSIHWSSCPETPSTNGGPDTGGGGDTPTPITSCHMAVVHQNNVTVWRVSGALPKLSFKQVRKINVRPIAQGCLWNPMDDTLGLLSRHQSSFYFRHDGNKGSFALPPLESGKISSGCWSCDGKQLVICVNTTIKVYQWPQITNSGESAFVCWSIPGLEGTITSVTPMPKNRIIVATEVPLESLCRRQQQDKQDAFITPDSNGTHNTPGDDVIRPSNSPSVTQSLMNLQTNLQTRETSSSLVLIKLQEAGREPSKLFSCAANGVLTPDILLYEKSSQCVVVGSNSQSQLHIYALLDKRLAYCGDIQLDTSQRPKGLCSVPTYFDERGAALLVLVGQRVGEELGVLSSSTETEFHLSLKYIIIKAGYESKKRETTHGDSFKSPRSTGNVRGGIPSLSKSESMREATPSRSEERILRVRSGSGFHSDIIPPPTSQSPPSHWSLSTSPRVSHISHQSPRIPPSTSPLPPQSSLSLSTMPPHHNPTPVMIQDLNDSPRTQSLSKDNLQTETTSFSSQKANFSNEKLSSKYQLNTAGKSENGKRLQTKQQSLQNPHSQQATLSNDLPHSDSVSSLSSLHSDHLGNRDSPRGSRHGKSDTPVVHKHSPTVNGTHSPGISELIKPSTSGIEVRKDSPLTSTTQQESKMLNPTTVLSKEDLTSDLGSSSHSSYSSIDSMEKVIRNQKDDIDALYKRLEELSMSVEDTAMVFPTKYQDMQTPELITITYCKDANLDKSGESKHFLLDNGRLQLEPLKLAFGLATVELLLDGVPIVLGCNIDGYIPLKFSPSSKLIISGVPADPTHRQTLPSV